jgi:hypothetical protein
MEDVSAKISRAEIEEAIRDLVRLGLVKDSGQRRNGKIVWVLTELGKLVQEGSRSKQ